MGAPAGNAVSGVVLAAGAGRRFGGPKALVSFDGTLFVERAIETLLAGGCAEVVVVLGAQAADVQQRADLGGVRVVVNEQWDDGMSTSLRAGLLACHGARAAVVTLVDQPGVTPEVVRRLIDAWVGDGCAVAVATYDGAARNPVLFGAEVWDDVIASLSGDTGARVWLRDNSALVHGVEVGDVGDCADIDTPEDLSAR